ncbi:hypothetical protein SDC9_84667 [bioreactor metagenome]|uniref:Amidohydrolase-related domain-containing protein n=1 Tax=bioreactor metagenome TaxID=1076179 RepID=A0A644ZJV3_9ZZZZ
MKISPDDYEVIDAHTHPFLDFATGCIGPYGTPQTMEEFDFEMKKVGISRYAGAPLCLNPKPGFSAIQRINADALRIRDRFPSYIPSIHIHGGFPEESLDELNRLYHKEEVRYIGELVPGIMHTGEVNTKGMISILREAGRLAMTVNICTGSRETVVPVLEQCPGLQVIIAHPGEPWGGEESSKARFKFVSEYEHLYMDISGYGLFRWNMLRYAIDYCGAEKLIFGSDMPTCSAGMYLYGVLCENLNEQEKRLILAGNFKRLLRME